MILSPLFLLFSLVSALPATKLLGNGEPLPFNGLTIRVPFEEMTVIHQNDSLVEPATIDLNEICSGYYLSNVYSQYELQAYDVFIPLFEHCVSPLFLICFNAVTLFFYLIICFFWFYYQKRNKEMNYKVSELISICIYIQTFCQLLKLTLICLDYFLLFQTAQSENIKIILQIFNALTLIIMASQSFYYLLIFHICKGLSIVRNQLTQNEQLNMMFWCFIFTFFTLKTSIYGDYWSWNNLIVILVHSLLIRRDALSEMLSLRLLKTQSLVLNRFQVVQLDQEENPIQTATQPKPYDSKIRFTKIVFCLLGVHLTIRLTVELMKYIPVSALYNFWILEVSDLLFYAALAYLFRVRSFPKYLLKRPQLPESPQSPNEENPEVALLSEHRNGNVILELTKHSQTLESEIKVISWKTVNGSRDLKLLFPYQ